MATKSKAPVEQEAHLAAEEAMMAPQVPTSYSHWLRSVVETLLESEQKWLALAAEQNELTLKALKESAEFVRTLQVPPATEWTRRSEEQFMEAQRRWLDSTTRQRETMMREMQGVEKGAEGTPTPNFQTATSFAREQVQGLVEARNRWLKFLAKQNSLFIQGIEEVMGVKEASPSDNRAKLVEETVDNYVELQKRLLNVVAPTTRAAAHPKAEGYHKVETEAHHAN